MPFRITERRRQQPVAELPAQSAPEIDVSRQGHGPRDILVRIGGDQIAET